MKKVITAVLLLCLVTGLLAGCGGTDSGQTVAETSETVETEGITKESSAEETTVAEETVSEVKASVQRGVLNVGVSEDATNWSPFAYAGSAKGVIFTVCEPLAGYVDGEFYPIILKEYSLSDDETVFHGTIFDYIKDSEGNAITADDVVFSYEMGSGDGTTVNFDRYVESFTATGDYEFEIKLTQSLPVGVLAKILKMNVVSKATFEATSDQMTAMPVGSGPYVLTNHTSGYEFTLEKRDDYWQTDEEYMTPYSNANVDTINFYVISESSQRTIALETGSIDVSSAIDSADIEKFLTTGNFWESKLATDQQYCLQPNCHEDTVCSDENLRKALFYAINNDAIAASALGETGFALHTLTPSSTIMYNEAWENEDNYLTSYDPDAAKEYLDKSDYNGETLILLCTSTDTMKNMAQILIGFWEAIGVKCEMQALDSAVFREKLSDYTAWDVQINAVANNGTTIELINGEHSTARSGTDRSKSFILDDDYQDMIKKCMTSSEFNQENIDELFAYIIDHAYMYSIAGMYQITIAPNWMSDPLLSAPSGAIVTFAQCTFTEE